jgi:hypothetical protein
MKRLALIATLALAPLALAVSPGIASAHRSATRAETRAMIQVADSPYALPNPTPQCVKADISTVVKGSQWGAFVQIWNKGACRNYQGDDWVIEHKIGSHWEPVTSGGFDPFPYVRGVPNRIAHDLLFWPWLL